MIKTIHDKYLTFRRKPFTRDRFSFVISFVILSLYSSSGLYSQVNELNACNITWNTQSKNSAGSMPCGGGDIGLNVWVENGDVLFYIARSGTFDENNSLLKLGRVRLRLTPNPFNSEEFKQTLSLIDGNVKISGSDNTELRIWVDAFNPIIHVESKSGKATHAEVFYENWRFEDKPVLGRANLGNSYKWAPQGSVQTYRDEIGFKGDEIEFYHRNKAETIFDITVAQQGLSGVKDQLSNPLSDLTFGGRLIAKGMQAADISTGKYIDTDYKSWKLKTVKPGKQQQIDIYLHTNKNASILNWEAELSAFVKNYKSNISTALNRTKNFWKTIWERSFIFINAEQKIDTSHSWQAGRNYQLFRYMLACNMYGEYPTKFNGGLFTYDPSLVDSTQKYTPDFRNWGGGTHTAQNQRLVYFPMLKSGDFELMKPQFDFYLRLKKNAEVRSQVYWQHSGASFTEQLENFGLPNPTEYGWKRPATFDKGLEYNAWLEYQWDTVLEFCLMMLEAERYSKLDITNYLPLIESSISFFNEHYIYEANKRGRRALDQNGHLVLYPGSSAETYKMAYNAVTTVVALNGLLKRMSELPPAYLDVNRKHTVDSLLKRIPPINYTQIDNKKMILPAKLWERINNTEAPQLYPVFPWHVFGVGLPELEVARNTYLYDTNVVKFRSHVGWKQDNIFAARLGFANDAARLTLLKLKNASTRFPAFWGPGYDWTPDHNWGGSGMIGLQEMLLQTPGNKIILFPAWPKTWDVHFKLAAPQKTTVEATVKNGKLHSLIITPDSRRGDVVNMLDVEEIK